MVGADGIFRIRLAGPQGKQDKALLFQAKIKVSVRREQGGAF
jgi:hypothetical protein